MATGGGGYLVEHEGDHKGPHDVGVGIDAQVQPDEDGVEDDTRLQHDGRHTVFRMLRCLHTSQHCGVRFSKVEVMAMPELGHRRREQF